MNCPFCNEEINDNTKFCKKCGARIPRCPSCGTVLKKKMRFCKNDGTPIPEEILHIFDQYGQREAANVESILPTVGVLNFKKAPEKKQKTAETESSDNIENSVDREAKRNRGFEVNEERTKQIKEQGPEEETSIESGNKGLIGLLVFFILTFTASIAGLIMLLSGGYVTLF